MEHKLPARFMRQLDRYAYKGIRPVVVETPQITQPFAAVAIADVKLPEEGEPKILEFGGIHSRLSGYPEGELTAVARIQKLVASIGIPVTILDGRTKPAHLLDPVVDNGSMVGGYFASGREFGFEYTTEFSRLLGDNQTCLDLNEIERLVCCVRVKDWPAIDTSRFLFVNPPRFSDLVRDKAACSALTDSRYKPQAWQLSKEDPLTSAQNALSISPEIEWFVLKPTCLSRGRGVTVIHRDELIERVHAICIAPAPTELANDWPRYQPPSEMPIENWLRFYPLMLEELVSSKPVRGADGANYDGVLRECFLTLSNQGQTVFVPFCAYWKLPGGSLQGGINTDSIVSDIKGGGGTAAVSPDDLARAFRAIPAVMPSVISASL